MSISRRRLNDFRMPSNISPNHWTDLKGKLLLFLFFLLFALTNISAQSPLVQHLTTSEGLPSNGVYKIFQDSKKYIWFATDAGVARYDGSKFTYYRKQDGLSSNDVFDIKEDSFGRIWFFHTNASLNFFTTAPYTMKKYFFPRYSEKHCSLPSTL